MANAIKRRKLKSRHAPHDPQRDGWVKLKSGTTEKENPSKSYWHSGQKNPEERSDKFSIRYPNKRSKAPFSVKFEYKYFDEASGGESGSYQVERRGSAEIPLSMMIELVSTGLSKSEYELSKVEIRNLLLAIASCSVGQNGDPL